MRIAVIGGGITGLAAALAVRDALPAARITVFDQAREVGGKLRSGELAGVPVEWGAEAFLIRQPGGTAESSARALARRLGLADDLVHPEPVPPALVLGGRLRPLPGGTLLGLPADPSGLAAALELPAAQETDTGAPVLAADRDIAVGELVRRRFGPDFGGGLVERLVDPLLGGVYAGSADTLSLAATMPGVAAACRREHTLVAAVRAALAASPRPAGSPVFATVRGGLSRLVAAVARAGGAELRLGLPVRAISAGAPGAGAPAAGAPGGGGPGGGGWRLTVGSTRDPEHVDVDGVILAVPARPAARLLRSVAPPAADATGALDYASVALITLALPAGTPLPDHSGLLVPAAERATVKAATFFARKWAHLAPAGGPVLVRASIGRYGEEPTLQQPDAALVEAAVADLARWVPGLPAPTASHVQRWGGSLPQYAPGHVTRVAAARAALPATVRVAGAGFDGVGIPACVSSGQRAGAELAAALREWPV